MPRLGELLVAARLLDHEQVERALRAQVVWGGRLGTNLIELGVLDLESISRALGRQHGMPAALARHFEKADRELQDRFPAALAKQWAVVPLLRVGPQKNRIAVAVLDPLPAEALAALGDALSCEPSAIVVSIAAEMRVRYHLERAYRVTRPPRFLRSKKKQSATPFPQFDNVPVPIDSDAEVAVPIAVDETEHPTGRAAPADPNETALAAAAAVAAAADTAAAAGTADAADAADATAAAAAVAAADAADAALGAAPTLVAVPAVSIADAAPASSALPAAELAPPPASALDALDAPTARTARRADASRAAALAATVSLPDDLAVFPTIAGTPLRPPASEQDIDEIARLIDEAIALVTTVEPAVPAGRDRRTYVHTLADDLPPSASRSPSVAASSTHPQRAPSPKTQPFPPSPSPRSSHAESAPTSHAQPPPSSQTQPVSPSQTQPFPPAHARAPASQAPSPALHAPLPSQTQPLGRVAIKRIVAVQPAPAAAPTAANAEPSTFVEATRAIRRASNRERVADLVMDTLQRFVPAAEAAVLLFVRGDLAISWHSFSRVCGITGDIAVPLDEPGLVPTVIERNAVARAGVTELGPIDEALLCSMGEVGGDLVIVPIAIANTVVGLIATATEPDAPVEDVEAVAAAAAAAVARLIRDASR